MTERTNFLTSVGRLVQGDAFKANTKDHMGNPLTVKTGANAGQPREDFFLALAIPKTDAGWAELDQMIKAVAAAGFPQFFPQGPNGQCSHPKFAWKITDGDSQQPNSKGSRPCDREGYPGHWILKLSSGFASKVYQRNDAGQLAEVTDPAALKRGYYIRVYGSVAANGNTQNPGVYLNHSMIEIVAFGPEIVSGPDANDVFGAAPALPQGASTTPAAPATPIAPPATTPAPAPAPAAGVAPAPDFLTPPPPAAAPAPAKRMAPNGVAYTEEQLAASGYTPEQIQALPIA
jgi:hypothetical protein